MAYFSNGTEGIMYEEDLCVKCLHWQEGMCPILIAHSLYNYKDCNNKESILHILIPRSDDGLTNEKCRMFIADPNYGQLDMF